MKKPEDQVIYRFVIKGLDPEDIPLARMAEYLKDLAVIMGEPDKVHLIRIEKGEDD